MPIHYTTKLLKHDNLNKSDEGMFLILSSYNVPKLRYKPPPLFFYMLENHSTLHDSYTGSVHMSV